MGREMEYLRRVVLAAKNERPMEVIKRTSWIDVESDLMDVVLLSPMEISIREGAGRPRVRLRLRNVGHRVQGFGSREPARPGVTVQWERCLLDGDSLELAFLGWFDWASDSDHAKLEFALGEPIGYAPEGRHQFVQLLVAHEDCEYFVERR